MTDKREKASPRPLAPPAREPSWILRLGGRIGVRLLLVNLLVLLVPVAGLELARAHERQLLEGLERDMKNQASLVATMLESDLGAGRPLGDPQHAEILTESAKKTRTRIRVLDPAGATVVDSHAKGPPEGPEPPPPHMLPRSYVSSDDSRPMSELTRDPNDPNAWPEIPARSEVKAALAGQRGAYTRVRARDPGVFLFITEPVRHDGAIAGAVYAVRSTRPVMVELYRIRASLIRILIVAFLFTSLVTALLSLSISRPLGLLSRAAKRVAAGEPDVAIPISGGGEIAELGQSFASMKERLDARLRYISDFAADVAHEFKSPLTSIRGAAELLGEGAADDPEARIRFLRNIELDVARLDRLVSRLLELSRIEASREAMMTVDLEALLLRVAEQKQSPDKPVTLRYEASMRFVRARETDLETAFLNLLDNALRFSPEGKPVTIDATGEPPFLTVAIRDEGPGISPKNLPKIFDRFFTTDSDRNGTGLGLSIVKAVVEAHGGRVSVESAPGEGATFRVLLPARR